MINKGETVVCIDIKNNKYLTIGKHYTTTKNDTLGLHIINDIDEESFYIPHAYEPVFKKLSEIREDKLKTLLND